MQEKCILRGGGLFKRELLDFAIDVNQLHNAVYPGIDWKVIKLFIHQHFSS